MTLLTRLVIALAILPLAAAIQANAQEVGPTLSDQILRLDSLVFAAFNERDIEAHLGFFSEDLEFYHDEAGLSTYASFVQSSHRLFSLENPLTRTLVDGSTIVHPVPDYGAIQIGSHEFCHLEDGTQDCGIFDFVHVWHLRNSRWQITRVLSYGH